MSVWFVFCVVGCVIHLVIAIDVYGVFSGVFIVCCFGVVIGVGGCGIVVDVVVVLAFVAGDVVVGVVGCGIDCVADVGIVDAVVFMYCWVVGVYVGVCVEVYCAGVGVCTAVYAAAAVVVGVLVVVGCVADDGVDDVDDDAGDGVDCVHHTQYWYTHTQQHRTH